MKIVLQLSDEEVRKILAAKVGNECSKHGYPGDIDRKIKVFLRCAGDEILEMPLEELGVSLHAEIEVS